MIEVLSPEELKEFLNSHSRYKISKETGIAQQSLSNYAIGKTEIAKISFDRVIKLTDYFNSLK